MKKEKSEKKEVKLVINKANEKIEEIIKDYPESLCAAPRGNFEDQLRKHLIKHKVK